MDYSHDATKRSSKAASDELSDWHGGRSADARSTDLVALVFGVLDEVKSRRGMFFVVAGLIFLAVVMGSYIRLPRYEATAKLLVKLDKNNVVLSQADQRYDVALKMADEAVGTQAELLRSRELIARALAQFDDSILMPKSQPGIFTVIVSGVNHVQKKVVDTLASAGLISQSTPRQKFMENVRSGLKILPARKSQMIDISLSLKNREGAQLILASLIQQQFKKLGEMEAAAQGYELYSEQSSELKSELGKAEAALAAFKVQHHFVDMTTEKATLLQNADRLKSMLNGIDGGGKIVTAKTAETEGAVGGDDGAIGTELMRLVSRIDDLRLEHNRLAGIYEPAHPKLEESQRQLAAAQRMIKGKVKDARAAMGSYIARSHELDDILPEYNRLTREVGVAEDNYKAYIKSTESRRLASAKDQRVSLVLVDAPRASNAPIGPSRLMIILIGLAGSILIALVWVLVANWWARRIRLIHIGN